MRQKTTDHTEEELRLKLLCFKTLRLPQLIFYYYYFRILAWGEIGRRVDRGFAGQFLSRSAFEGIEVILRALSVKYDVQFRCQRPWRICGSRQRGPVEGLSAHQLLVLGLHSLYWQKSTVDLNPQSTSVSKTSVSPIPAIIVPGSEKREFTAEQSTIFHLKGQKSTFQKKNKLPSWKLILIVTIF